LELLKKGEEVEQIQLALKEKFMVEEADLRTDISEFLNLLKANNLLPRSFAI
jgi:hypothetical protein